MRRRILLIAALVGGLMIGAQMQPESVRPTAQALCIVIPPLPPVTLSPNTICI